MAVGRFCARGSPSAGRRRYSVKVCSAGYQVVWTPAALSSARKRSRASRSAQQHGEGEVRGALDGLLVQHELDAGDLGQSLAVGADDRAAGRDALLQARQAAEPKRGTGLVEAVVEADVDHVVGGVVAAVAVPGAAGQRMRAQQPHARGELLVGGAHHAALADAQLLLGEEAERAELADRADLAAIVVDVARRSPGRSPRSA